MRTTRWARWMSWPVMASVLFAVAGAVPAFGQYGQPSTSKPKQEGQSEREVDLRPKFKKGDQTRFIMTIDSTGTTSTEEVGGGKPSGSGRPGSSKPNSTKPSKPNSSASKPADQTMTQEIGLLLRVKEADPEKGAVVELVYESLKLSLKSEGMDVDFDSTKKPGGKPSKQTPGKSKPGKSNQPDPDALPDMSGIPTEADMVESMLRPMVGTTITMQVDRDGNIVSTSGGSGLSPASMLSALGGAGGAMGGMGGGGDAAALGALFSVAKGKGSAAVGESWTTNDTMNGSVIGDFRIVNKTTVKSASRGLAELGFAGKLEPGTQGGAGPLSGMAQVQESDFTGQATWDTERGMLKTMTSQQRVVMDATVPDMDEGQKTVRLTSRTNVKVKRVD